MPVQVELGEAFSVGLRPTDAWQTLVVPTGVTQLNVDVDWYVDAREVTPGG